MRLPKRYSDKVLRVVKTIPRGEILTYAEVARQAGRPRAYRAVGNILNKNYDSMIPCHRVVRSDGRVGGYNRGVKEKIRLLEAEGVMARRGMNPRPTTAL